MHRTTATNKHSNKFGTGKHGFRDRVVGPLVLGTTLTASDQDAHQEEITRACELAGLVVYPDDTDDTYEQLAEAMDVFAAAKLAANLTRQTPDSSFTGAFNGGCFGGNDTDGYLFVLVGNSGEIQTSPEGRTWTTRAAGSAFASFFMSVHYGGGVYVACGIGGEIQSTPASAISFTRRTHPAYTDQWEAGCYFPGASLHVLVGENGEIQTSPDGTTWTHRSNAGGSPDFTGVAASDTAVIALGSGVAHRSTNGTSWTLLTLPAGSPSKIVYDADRERFIITNGPYSFLESYDNGTTWTEFNPTPTVSIAASPLAVGEGVFVIGTLGDGVYVATGWEASRWKLGTGGGEVTAADAFQVATFGLGRFVLAGQSGLIFSSLVVT